MHFPALPVFTYMDREPAGPPGPDDAELALWDRFLAGEASDADEATIRRWSAASRSTKLPPASVRQAVRVALAPAGDPPAVDAMVMLARLRTRLAQASDPCAGTSPPRYGFDDTNIWATSASPVPPARRAAVTTVAWATAAAITIMTATHVSDAATRWVRLGPRDTGSYQAGPYERLHMRLPDGTEVVAAPNTTVRISGPSDRRSMYVRGEAYVDANRDESRSLLVHAGNAVLENVGARFAIRTDSDGKEVRIAVATGVVLAGDSGAPWQTARVLTRGTFGVVSARGPTRMFRPTDPDDAVVWEAGGVHWGRDQLRDELPRVGWDGA